MTVLWWLVGLALVVLSALLLAAGVQGKEGVLRIGQPHDPRSPDVPVQPAGMTGGQASGQPTATNGPASGQPGSPAPTEAQAMAGPAEAPELAGSKEARGVPDSAPPAQEAPGLVPPARMNLANVAIGAAGIVVGLAAIIIFAI